MDERDPVTPDGHTGEPAAEPGEQHPAHRSAWYRSLGRRGRIAAVAGAAAVALGVSLSLIGSGSPGHTSHTRKLVAAKNFTLTVLGHSGQHLSLSQYAGKPVILNFFASWCAPCQKETPVIAKFYKETHGAVTVIGIDVNDTSSSALTFVHAKGVTYPVGTDPLPSPTAAAYGVAALPQTFFLDARHLIVKRVFGPVTLHEMQAGAALIRQPK